MISNYPDREDKYEDYSKFGGNEKEVARIGLSYSPPFVIIIYANEEDDDDYTAIVYQAYSALSSNTNVTVPYRT